MSRCNASVGPMSRAMCNVQSSLRADCGLPLVATNDVRFLRREDFESHEARVCIQQGRTLADPTRPRENIPSIST